MDVQTSNINLVDRRVTITYPVIDKKVVNSFHELPPSPL